MSGGMRHLPAARDHARAIMRTVLTHVGEPLPAGVRADLEPRFGADLSAVRVHADETAQVSARQQGARAYTVGQHVVFGANQYAPGTAAGRALLAHEVVHTMQQGGQNPAGAVPHELASPAAEIAARGTSARALAGAATAAGPVIERTGLAIARDEGTAEVVDTVTDFQHHGSAYTAEVQRDQYRTHAEAEQARKGGHPPFMDSAHTNIELDTTTGAITIPVTVTVRHAKDTDLGGGKPAKLASGDITAAQVNQIGDAFIAEVNKGLNNWFTLYVPACQGVPWSGRELPVTVRVTRGGASVADFTVAVSQHTGRSWVDSAGLVLLYAGDLDAMTMRHEGGHMALGHPDEYEETDAARRREAPLQKSDERVFHDWTLMGDDVAWGIFSVLRARHFSFVPAFMQRVLADLHHPECVPVLHEVRRPQPSLLRVTLGVGGSSYGGNLHLEAGLDAGRFLDKDRDWRLFLGAHAHAFVLGLDHPDAYMLGARVGFERKWRSARSGPTAEAFTEIGATAEAGAGARAPAAFAGAGGSLGVSFWNNGSEFQVKLTGEEVVRLDAEAYHAYQAGLQLGLSW